MFLQPNEVGFLNHLKEAKVPLVEFEIPPKKILDIQSQLEMLIGKNYYLNKVSKTNTTWCFGSHANNATVRERRLPILPPSIRLSLSAFRLQHPPTRFEEGRQGFWIWCATKGRH
jgi:hypothetical protein